MLDLTDINSLKGLLGRYHVHLTQKLGQHFLVHRQVLEKIIEAAELDKRDVVLEIGPGAGTLTVELAARAKRVVTVEKDRRLLKVLKFAIRNFNNVTVIESDILSVNLKEALQPASGGFKVVANIPYNITGEILRLLLAGQSKPQSVVLLVQKEVGRRVTAQPGDMSILAASVQFYGQPEIISLVPKECFFPAPEVDSVILKIKVYTRPIFDIPDKEFFRLVKIGFSARRKTLLNNLSAGFLVDKSRLTAIAKKSGFDLQRRAQELSLEEWRELYTLVSSIKYKV